MGYDESFQRLWTIYLAYCEAGFAERRICDVQLLLAKPQWAVRPRPPSPRRRRGRRRRRLNVRRLTPSALR